MEGGSVKERGVCVCERERERERDREQMCVLCFVLFCFVFE